MNVGDTLKRARLRKQLTLQQLAQQTKINAHALEALEENDFDRLPADVYVRGFIRTYAREVDLDPEETVSEHVRELEEEFAPAAPTPTEEAELAQERLARDRALSIVRREIPMSALFATLAVIALGSYLLFGTRRHQEAQPTVTTQSAPPATAPPAAMATPPTPDAQRAANVTPDTLRLELKISGPCWVSATADRAPAFARLFNAGESQALEAKDEFVLRVGDPATVSIKVNGVAARPLGPAGQAVTVEINKQNYREFLSL